ncbi:hypothetical protein [Streptomyces sp. NBC_01546]|uniref:hypothetical protein n=1 Tax=Streptomyces sp. NBC_01546 TaxID=2975872 RepID=UPI003870A7E4
METLIEQPRSTRHEHRASSGLLRHQALTFGGSITARTPGFLAKALVRQGKGGDFRNPERIQTWARHIGAELAA